MKKPKIKTIKYLDYNECEKYIANLLKVKDLRDFAGKYNNKQKENTLPYQDFWHTVLDYGEIHNGGFFSMNDILIYKSNFEDWELKIIKTFQKEFGKNTLYWVEW